LSFLSFGYATEEFEVTEERLGVYRPEEHIDNPKDYVCNRILFSRAFGAVSLLLDHVSGLFLSLYKKRSKTLTSC
jgi:hypothetical protein